MVNLYHFLNRDAVDHRSGSADCFAGIFRDDHSKRVTAILNTVMLCLFAQASLETVWSLARSHFAKSKQKWSIWEFKYKFIMRNWWIFFW